jgi:hypothetical protein
LGSCLACPREVQSPEKGVLELWPSVRVRERESKEEDNGQGFKYPWTRAQPDIDWADRTLSGPSDFIWPGLYVHREIAD